MQSTEVRSDSGGSPPEELHEPPAGVPSGTDADRRAQLADFLRAKRLAVQPEDIGLRSRGRRRVKGLRREEVADLASVSVTWYTWLEQARDIRTTPQVLDSIARALRLDEASHRYLRRLGGHPVTTSPSPPAASPSGLLALVDDLLPCPATLITPNGDLVAWNRGLCRLWDDPEQLRLEHRNGLIMLLREPVRTRLVDWEAHSEQAIASFRAEAGKHVGDRRFAEVVAHLTETCDVFRQAWERHDVRRLAGDQYTYRHPEVGEITTEQVGLRPMGAPSLILVVHRLVDDPSRARMKALLEADDRRGAVRGSKIASDLMG